MGLPEFIKNRAIEEARLSNYRFRLGAVIFKGTRILSSGHNGIRSCYRIPKRYRKWENSLHAEMSCVINYLSNRGGEKKGLNGASLLVLRISSTKELIDNARPCSHCLSSLFYFGIEKIYYSNYDGKILLL